MASAQCKNLLMTSFLAVRFSQAHERKANDDDEDAEKNQDGVCYTKVSVSTVNPNMKTLTLLSSSCTTTTDDPLEQQQRKPPGFHFLCKFLFCLYSICCNCHFKWPDLLYNASHRLPISIFQDELAAIGRFCITSSGEMKRQKTRAVPSSSFEASWSKLHRRDLD